METPAAKSEAKPASDKDNKSKDKDKDKKKSAVEERRSYPLRVGVAKPADIYTPTFGNASGASPAVTGKAPDASKTPASKPGQKPGAAAGSGVGTRVERVLGKRKRNSKTEFLVKWVGRDASANSWEPAKGVDERLVEQYEEKRRKRQMLQQGAGRTQEDIAPDEETVLRQSLVAHRILAQREFAEGVRYLVHWRGSTASAAQWVTARAVGNDAVVRQYEAAVRRVRALSTADLNSGNYTLSGLGFANATYFQGVHARNPDGSLRMPVVTPPAPAPRAGSAPPARRTASNGGNAPPSEPAHRGPGRPPKDARKPGASSGVARGDENARPPPRHEADGGGAAERRVVLRPDGSRVGIAKGLGDMLKRKRRKGADGWESPPPESYDWEDAAFEYEEQSPAQRQTPPPPQPGALSGRPQKIGAAAAAAAAAAGLVPLGGGDSHAEALLPRFLPPISVKAIVSLVTPPVPKPGQRAAAPPPGPPGPPRVRLQLRLTGTPRPRPRRKRPEPSSGLTWTTVKMRLKNDGVDRGGTPYTFTRRLPPAPPPMPLGTANGGVGGYLGAAGPSTLSALLPRPGASHHTVRKRQPPLAASSATYLVVDNPAAFASQLQSALTLDSAARNQATSQLNFDAGGQKLPTAPPGHQYALGPRRGHYTVLQCVNMQSENSAYASVQQQQQLMMQQYAMQMQQMQPGAPQQVHMVQPGQPGQPQQQMVMVGPNGQIMHQIAGHYVHAPGGQPVQVQVQPSSMPGQQIGQPMNPGAMHARPVHARMVQMAPQQRPPAPAAKVPGASAGGAPAADGAAPPQPQPMPVGGGNIVTVMLPPGAVPPGGEGRTWFQQVMLPPGMTLPPGAMIQQGPGGMIQQVVPGGGAPGQHGQMIFLPGTGAGPFPAMQPAQAAPREERSSSASASTGEGGEGGGGAPAPALPKLAPKVMPALVASKGTVTASVVGATPTVTAGVVAAAPTSTPAGGDAKGQMPGSPMLASKAKAGSGGTATATAVAMALPTGPGGPTPGAAGPSAYLVPDGQGGYRTINACDATCAMAPTAGAASGAPKPTVVAATAATAVPAAVPAAAVPAAVPTAVPAAIPAAAAAATATAAAEAETATAAVAVATAATAVAAVGDVQAAAVPQEEEGEEDEEGEDEADAEMGVEAEAEPEAEEGEEADEEEAEAGEMAADDADEDGVEEEEGVDEDVEDEEVEEEDVEPEEEAEEGEQADGADEGEQDEMDVEEDDGIEDEEVEPDDDEADEAAEGDEQMLDAADDDDDGIEDEEVEPDDDEADEANEANEAADEEEEEEEEAVDEDRDEDEAL